MAMCQYVTESMAYMLSGNMDQGAKDFQLEAAISKFMHRAVGIKSGPSLAEHVHADLAPRPSWYASEAAGDFGATVEKILIRHGKGIRDEQFILKRLADAAIDIYGMAAVLSRASRSLNNKIETAQHEALLTTVYCDEAFDRIRQNLDSLHDSNKLSNDTKMSRIATEVIRT
ncbi:hypothetical protein OS493_028655 [Desmophyllum pertusum]|uniref:ACAD9/ACADV-like C-terminal domain-containing protein n=1 Tax=Desmophyllum pertusum TaxID=174260 RepID=A0A9W9YKC8_9CNID|nr:hypothetical protein OS493_028655 [Desmophyllum pertusum]